MMSDTVTLEMVEKAINDTWKWRYGYHRITQEIFEDAIAAGVDWARSLAFWATHPDPADEIDDPDFNGEGVA